MFKATTFLLVCLVGLATVMGMNPQPPLNHWPEVVNARKYYCQSKSLTYVGACITQNLVPADPQISTRCDQVYCAEPTAVTGVYNAIPVGPAPDGMRCSRKGACRNKVCVDIKAAGLAMPFQLGPDTEYQCRAAPAVRASTSRTATVTKPR